MLSGISDCKRGRRCPQTRWMDGFKRIKGLGLKDDAMNKERGEIGIQCGGPADYGIS